MNSTPDFDSETHDYDVLLKGSSSVESISNGATPAVIQAAHMQAAVQVAHESPSSPHIASMTAQQQQHHLQQQRQQMGDSAMPSSTSPPAMAPIPRGPTFMGSSGVSEVKLKRFLEHNQRLREHLEMRRIPVSEASNR
ncbi:hypothetical protein FBU30_005816 [Linnemannia zychae]|nr:hypothetical protein FBU30_005816 [Linnemannia zychae]